MNRTLWVTPSGTRTPLTVFESELSWFVCLKQCDCDGNELGMDRLIITSLLFSCKGEKVATERNVWTMAGIKVYYPGQRTKARLQSPAVKVDVSPHFLASYKPNVQLCCNADYCREVLKSFLGTQSFSSAHCAPSKNLSLNLALYSVRTHSWKHDCTFQLKQLTSECRRALMTGSHGIH